MTQPQQDKGLLGGLSSLAGKLHGGASSAIESAARGTKDMVTGGAPTPSAQTERGMELIKNLGLGGLALGAGTGGVVALVNYLKGLQKEDELEDESRLNDDTLYVPAVSKAAAEVHPLLAPGIAVTGGILGSAAGYSLVQKIYNHYQKKRRQKMLDDAQQEALVASDAEIAKAAAADGVDWSLKEPPKAKMNWYDVGTALPVALPLLALLASGGVTYAALRKSFPTVKKPKSKYPKRVRQVATGRGEEEVEKAAGFRDYLAEEDVEHAAEEFLMLMVDQLGQEKAAAHRLTSEIINRVAKEGLGDLEETLRHGGLEAVMEITKGAAEDPVDVPNRVLAAAAITKSARLRPIVTHLAASEFQELLPDTAASVLSSPEEELDKYAGLAAVMHLALLRPQMLDKSAATNPLIEELKGLIEFPSAYPQMSDASDMEDALTTDAAGNAVEETDGDDREVVPGAEVDQTPDDPVDEMLQDPQGSPLLNPDTEIEEEEAQATDAAYAPL